MPGCSSLVPGHGQGDAGTIAVGSCFQFIYVKFGKKKNQPFFIFSVQWPRSLTFCLLFCDDQNGDVFTPGNFQGTRGACSQFI